MRYGCSATSRNHLSLDHQNYFKSRGRGPSYISRTKIWNPMKDVAFFVTAIYTKYRFESPVYTATPRNDLVHISGKGSYEGNHHSIQWTFVVFVRTVGMIRV